MNRDSFVFYKSWSDAIELLPEEDKARAYLALIRYACTGEADELTGPAKIIFTLAQPIIDTNNKRFEDGNRGGRPKKPVVLNSKTSGFENENQWLRKRKPNEKENENENENVNVNDNESVNVSENEKEINNNTGDISLFDLFWTSYPKKVGKEQARKAFTKLKPTAEDVDTWIRAVEAQKQSRQWRDSQFIPYPATWLNGKRWQDVPETGDQFVSGELPF